MSEFTHILNQIKEHLDNVPYENGDFSDVGKEFGIVIGRYIETEDDFKDLVSGLRYGISLTNGIY